MQARHFGLPSPSLQVWRPCRRQFQHLRREANRNEPKKVLPPQKSSFTFRIVFQSLLCWPAQHYNQLCVTRFLYFSLSRIAMIQRTDAYVTSLVPKRKKKVSFFLFVLFFFLVLLWGIRLNNNHAEANVFPLSRLC